MDILNYIIVEIEISSDRALQVFKIFHRMGGKHKYKPKSIEELRTNAQVAKVLHKFNLLEFFNKLQ